MRVVPLAQVLDAEETPAPTLDPGRGKTERAYLRIHARGAFDAVSG